jgi:hypothetical protein
MEPYAFVYSYVYIISETAQLIWMKFAIDYAHQVTASVV